MIPADFIAEWRAHTRWATDEQVEQDLALSRALVTIFEDPELASTLALRGGTALHKLHLPSSRRTSTGNSACRSSRTTSLCCFRQARRSTLRPASRGWPTTRGRAVPSEEVP